MKQRTRRFGVLLAAAGLVVATASGAWAVTITVPASNPFTVPGDASGNPVFFNITATGFSPTEPVFVQQCDGVPSTTTGYSASEHCDLASGNSPVNANGSGSATFSASDSTQRLNVFKGPSPQELFNCLSPNDPALSNGLPNFRNCQVRVSGGTPADTTEQAFFSIVLPDAVAAGGPTHVGDCGGSVALVKLASTVKGQGLGDQTAQVKITGAIAKDQTSKTAVNGGGSCSGVIRVGDIHVPNGPHAGLTAKAEAISFLGNTSCANGATAVAVDATAANAYPPNGKITWTFNQTYVDLTTALVHPYKMQADVALLGFDATLPDVVNVGGIVLTGLNAGATVSGRIWEDPVALTHGASGYNTGYELDLASAAGCADGTANNANILIVLSGGGGASAMSLLGSNVANSLSFDFGQ